MSLRRLCYKVLACIITKGLVLYFKTMRIEIVGKERAAQELTSSSTGCVFLFWHDALMASPLLEWATALQPICVLISNSKDGDLPAEMGKQYRNVRVIRVKAASRTTALLQSCEVLEQRESLFITPDGPRGPRHKIKLGALYACQKAHASIIPVVYAASRQITLSSWDRLRIPKPFSRLICSYLEPVVCPSEGELDTIKTTIEQQMEAEERRLSLLIAR